MSNEIRLADLVVDCPDAKKLSQFYHERWTGNYGTVRQPRLSAKTA